MNLKPIINASESIKEEFIETVIKPIYGYRGYYNDILMSLKYIPESSLSSPILKAVNDFIAKYNL